MIFMVQNIKSFISKGILIIGIAKRMDHVDNKCMTTKGDIECLQDADE